MNCSPNAARRHDSPEAEPAGEGGGVLPPTQASACQEPSQRRETPSCSGSRVPVADCTSAALTMTGSLVFGRQGTMGAPRSAGKAWKTPALSSLSCRTQRETDHRLVKCPGSKRRGHNHSPAWADWGLSSPGKALPCQAVLRLSCLVCCSLPPCVLIF